MTNTRQLLSWFNKKHTESQERTAHLREDSREDEAVLEKIRTNIYGMFSAMFEVAARRSQDEPATTKLLFFKRAESCAAEWEDSLQKADSNGDVLKMTIEKLKLDTFAEIRAKVDTLDEDEL